MARRDMSLGGSPESRAPYTHGGFGDYHYV